MCGVGFKWKREINGKSLCLGAGYRPQGCVMGYVGAVVLICSCISTASPEGKRADERPGMQS